MLCYVAHVQRFQWWHTWDFSNFDFLNFPLLQMEFVVRKRSWFGIKRKNVVLFKCSDVERTRGRSENENSFTPNFPLYYNIEANILCILNKLKVTRKVKIVLSNSSLFVISPCRCLFLSDEMWNFFCHSGKCHGQ